MQVPAFLKLAPRFDIDKLKADLRIAESAFERSRVLGPYADGAWSGISLKSNNGETSDLEAFLQGDCQDTAVLAQCPYFKELIDQLPFPTGVVRLLFLPPGKVIGKHKDSNSWENGYIRLHLPIVTHPKVIMTIDGETELMNEGELWFGDFSKIHSVINHSEIMRVHMVIDSYVNEDLLALFPTAMVDELKNNNAVYTIPKEDQQFKPDLSQYQGFYRSKQGIFSILGKITEEDHRLHMQILGFPYIFTYAPVAKDRFQHMKNILKTLKDDNENPVLYFGIDGGDIDDIRIDLFGKLGALDYCQYYFQAIMGKIALSAYYGYAGSMQMYRKIFKIKL